MRRIRLGRDVAIKVLPPAFATDVERRARFEREAQTVAALSHPHVVSLFDTGVHKGQVFVVMALLDGETLRQRLTVAFALEALSGSAATTVIPTIESSHRVIPLNASAVRALSRMIERADQLGHTSPDHYLWPACQWGQIDATKPIQKWDTAWRALRTAADLPGFRFHDLRHTVITELAEMGVPDHVLKSISGHLSRRMLEHYSHIRLKAKREALEALDAHREQTATSLPRRTAAAPRFSSEESHVGPIVDAMPEQAYSE